jgi:hypothetical protein
MGLAGVGKPAEALVVEQIAGQPDLALLLLELPEVPEAEILIHAPALD